MAEREAPLSAAQVRSLFPVRSDRSAPPAFDVVTTAPVIEWLTSEADSGTDELRAELTELDLVDDEGLRTDAARWLRDTLRPSVTRGIRVDAVDADGGQVLLAGIAGTVAAVVMSTDDEGWGLSIVGSSALPNLICRSMALVPSSVIDEVDRDITLDELRAAVSRQQFDEPAEDALLVDALLTVPWRRVSIRTSDGAGLDIAQVETWGLFELQAGEDAAITLASVGSDEFYQMLVDVVAELAMGDEPWDA